MGVFLILITFNYLFGGISDGENSSFPEEQAVVAKFKFEISSWTS